MSSRRGKLFGQKMKRLGPGLMSNKELAIALRSGALFEVKKKEDYEAEDCTKENEGLLSPIQQKS